MRQFSETRAPRAPRAALQKLCWPVATRPCGEAGQAARGQAQGARGAADRAQAHQRRGLRGDARDQVRRAGQERRRGERGPGRGAFRVHVGGAHSSARGRRRRTAGDAKNSHNNARWLHARRTSLGSVFIAEEGRRARDAFGQSMARRRTHAAARRRRRGQEERLREEGGDECAEGAKARGVAPAAPRAAEGRLARAGMLGARPRRRAVAGRALQFARRG